MFKGWEYRALWLEFSFDRIQWTRATHIYSTLTPHTHTRAPMYTRKEEIEAFQGNWSCFSLSGRGVESHQKDKTLSVVGFLLPI